MTLTVLTLNTGHTARCARDDVPDYEVRAIEAYREVLLVLRHGSTQGLENRQILLVWQFKRTHPNYRVGALDRGGPLPGDLCAYRLDDLLVSEKSAAFQLMRGREEIAWINVCAVESGADRLWESLEPFTASERPTVPWACILHEVGLRALTAADVERMNEVARSVSWAALELLNESES